jgi:hypothetical protein
MGVETTGIYTSHRGFQLNTLEKLQYVFSLTGKRGSPQSGVELHALENPSPVSFVVVASIKEKLYSRIE